VNCDRRTAPSCHHGARLYGRIDESLHFGEGYDSVKIPVNFNLPHFNLPQSKPIAKVLVKRFRPPLIPTRIASRAEEVRAHILSMPSTCQPIFAK
jgi:hypothetical protein